MKDTEYKKQIEFRDAHDAFSASWTRLCKCIGKSQKKFNAAKAAYETAKNTLHRISKSPNAFR